MINKKMFGFYVPRKSDNNIDRPGKVSGSSTKENLFELNLKFLIS